MESHLYNAKRMKTIDWYGFKVAAKRNDKCRRASIRWSKYSQTILDLSYYSVLIESKKNQDSLHCF